MSQRTVSKPRTCAHCGVTFAMTAAELVKHAAVCVYRGK